jgi:hypothetical protein
MATGGQPRTSGAQERIVAKPGKIQQNQWFMATEIVVFVPMFCADVERGISEP